MTMTLFVQMPEVTTLQPTGFNSFRTELMRSEVQRLLYFMRKESVSEIEVKGKSETVTRSY